MASNIQIVGNIISTNTLSRYSTTDTGLIGTQEIQESFDPTQDYVEYYVYDIGGNLLEVNYSYVGYKLPTTNALNPAYTPANNSAGSITTGDIGLVNSNTPNTGSSFSYIEIDPINDLQQLGYKSGEYSVQYNFFNNKVSSPSAEYFLKRISADRTEISISSTTISNNTVEMTADLLFNEISASFYYTNYLVNFGLNQQFATTNVALNKIDSGYEILFKLYQPLPANIVEKSTLWVVAEKVTPYTFDINLDTLILPPAPLMLRGANFNIPIPSYTNHVSSQYSSHDDLMGALQVSQSNTYHKLLNTLTSQSIAINVDYTNYANFAFFGSVKQRLGNFYNKVQQIEDYSNLINSYTSSAVTYPSRQIEINTYSASINDIIAQFDGYETYLYFESNSYAWPKSSTTLPYALYSTGSATAITWYNNNSASASLYDEGNPNILNNNIPTFLIDDPNNSQYLVFLNMVGQYFDNIWILLKSVTDINVANNNLNDGVSKDLVYQVLKSFGINLYNSLGGEDLSQYLVGNNTGSAIISGSLTDFSPTSSYLNNIPKRDLLAELYKRIYHNLPYLVKTKGTTTGLQTIVSIFGVTSSILNVKEYGGDYKPNFLKGYSTNKVRISERNDTGSLLSPLVSIQEPPSASVDFLDNDLQFVDISFSPQTQLDLYVSQSISTNNSTWDLDDYIGDPRQQFSGSYPDLATQRNIYFNQGTGSYAGFTGSLLDYNGFIRLIQFFDNSLFKTLEDFVPLRTSLSTGITFNSPVLERNKFAYSNPNTTTTESIQTAEITTSSIGTEYGNFYNNLSGNKMPYYTGEISGSEINIHNDYFIPNNVNPYLGDFNTWNNQHTITQSISLNKFALSDYNVLFNNVSSSRLSNTRKLLETPGTPGIEFTYVYPFNYSNAFINLSTSNDTYTINVIQNKVFDMTFYNTGYDDVVVYDGDVYSGIVLFTLFSGSIGTYTTRFTSANGTVTFYNVNNYNHDTYINNLSITSNGSYTSSAELQDSNLSLTSYQRSRWDGTKIQSAAYNIYTAGDKGSFGSTSAIDKYQSYFLVFKGMSGTYPEIVNKSVMYVNNLVDDQGNQITVGGTGSNYYYNLINTFGKDRFAGITIQSSNGKILHQDTTIFKPGAGFPNVILTNESASNNDSGTPSFIISPSIRLVTVAKTGSYPIYVSSSAIWSTGSLNQIYTQISYTQSAIPVNPNQLSHMYYSTSQSSILTSQDVTTNGYGGYPGGPNVSGYGIPIDFKILPGQEVRFNQDENQTYIITQVSSTLGIELGFSNIYTYKLELNITPPLHDYITSSIISPIISGAPSVIPLSFLIRQYSEDTSQMLINGTRVLPGTPGYMKPQYLSPTLSASFDATIQQLKKDKLI